MEKNPSSTSEKSIALLGQAKAMAAQGNKVVAVALLSQYIAQARKQKLRKPTVCVVHCSYKWVTSEERKKTLKLCCASILNSQMATSNSIRY